MGYYKIITQGDNKYTLLVQWLPFRNFKEAEMYAQETYGIVGGYNVGGKYAHLCGTEYKSYGMLPGDNVPPVLSETILCTYSKLISNTFKRRNRKFPAKFQEFCIKNNIEYGNLVKTNEISGILGKFHEIVVTECFATSAFTSEIKETISILFPNLSEKELNGKHLYLITKKSV